MTYECRGCRVVKPASDFYADKRTAKGHLSRCKACVSTYQNEYRRNRRLTDPTWREREKHWSRNCKPQRRFAGGVNEAERDALLAAQGGVCAICKQIETTSNGRGGVRNLAVDHDHKTGEVRGLLCAACNKGLGFFRDDPDLIEKAIKYLEEKK